MLGSAGSRGNATRFGCENRAATVDYKPLFGVLEILPLGQGTPKGLGQDEGPSRQALGAKERVSIMKRLERSKGPPGRQKPVRTSPQGFSRALGSTYSADRVTPCLVE